MVLWEAVLSAGPGASPSWRTTNTAAVNAFPQKVPARMSYAARRLPRSPVNSTAASAELAGRGYAEGWPDLTGASIRATRAGHEQVVGVNWVSL